MSETLSKQSILGVDVASDSMDRILEYLATRLHTSNEKTFIITPNPEIVVYAGQHTKFRNILNRAQIALPDGVGIIWAGRFLNKPFKQRITGVDFMETLCEKFSKGTETMGLLGGRGKVAEETAKCLIKKHPGLHIAYVGEEWNERNFMSQLKDSHTDHLDMLFVAFGFPKQEQWIEKNLDRIPVTAAIGVGGAFDYISGKVGRAPLFLRKLGLEWLWRLGRQPWRWKRQLALIKFVWLILNEKYAH